MSASIYIHLIEWDEFHRRFAEMDFSQAEKGLFHRLFEAPQKEEEKASTVLFALMDFHRMLKIAHCASPGKNGEVAPRRKNLRHPKFRCADNGWKTLSSPLRA